MKVKTTFINRAKSGAKALVARWRQASEQARLMRTKPRRRNVR